MAKIKSAIELAMEKTASLTMDEEERKSFERKEIALKIRTLVRRYMEGMINTDNVLKELAMIKGEEGIKMSVLFEQLIEELGLEKDNSLTIKLIEHLYVQRDPVLHEKIEKLGKDMYGKMKRKERAIEEEIELRLRSMGIKGNAVMVNLKAWDEWKHLLIASNKAYREGLYSLIVGS